MAVIEQSRLEEIAGQLGFTFDGAPENIFIKNRKSDFPLTIAEPGHARMAQIFEDNHIVPDWLDGQDGILSSYQEAEITGLLSWPKDINANQDKTLHGLIEGRSGRIAIHAKGEKGKDTLYLFSTTNGAEGTNRAHRTIGRAPGDDIPKFVEHQTDQTEFYAGQITEAIANMQMPAPGINDFYMVRHDLSAGMASHGRAWAHTQAAFYKNISRVAQEAIEVYGLGRIHFSNDDERDNRPSIVIDIARALDNLIVDARFLIKAAAVTELKIREDRYDGWSDHVVIAELLNQGVEHSRRLRRRQVLGFEGYGEQERRRRGYWTGLQFFAGVLETRIALHQVKPHEAATDAQTLRTLGILAAAKNELDSRIADNRSFIFAE